MQVIQFSFYYVKLQLSLLTHLAQTALPTDIVWRWNYWHRRRYASRMRSY